MDFSGYYYTIHRGKYIKNYQRYENAIKAFYKLVGKDDGYFRTAWNFDVSHWVDLKCIMPPSPKESETGTE